MGSCVARTRLMGWVGWVWVATAMVLMPVEAVCRRVRHAAMRHLERRIQ
jgi:hypothetical protein